MAQTSESERDAFVGAIAAVVAHEVNSPLSIILGRVELMADSLHDPEAMARGLELVTEHAHRIERVVKALQVLARPELRERTGVNLGTLVQQAWELGGRRLGQATLALEDPDQLQVLVDVGLARLAVEAVLMHAVEASRRRGEIRASIAESGSLALLDVHDLGNGVPPGLRELLDGDVTGAGRGVGLGMAVAATVVREHGGELTIVDDSPSGATYRLSLPRA